jgi:DNA polymerase III subunit epsilon
MRLALRRRPRSAAAAAYRQARPSYPATPWRRARFSVVDLETTGLDPRRDEIISFASVPVDEGRVVVGEVRSAIVRPSRMPEAETIRIHGLRPSDLVGAPALVDAIEPIVESLTGRVVVAHAAWVERAFLGAALHAVGLRLAEPVLDTAGLARHLLVASEDGEEQSLELSDTARRLGLPVHRPHHADGDALTTAQLFIALASHLDRTDPQTIGSLARLSQR